MFTRRLYSVSNPTTDQIYQICIFGQRERDTHIVLCQIASHDYSLGGSTVLGAALHSPGFHV